MEVTIKRHCVENSGDLSPLQQNLLQHPARLRIVDAPTGAGKTYAFQKALEQKDKQVRILFIVPTRRLAQNIAAGVMADLEEAGWTKANAQRKIALWSSDETSRLREHDEHFNVHGYRIRQIQALDTTRREGEMIVAIPEVVSYLLNKRQLQKGQSSMGIFDMLDQFDHIVFDEFHTIGAREFGLAVVFAKLAMYYGRAKISLLSATPLKIQPVFEEVGIPATEMVKLHESIVDDGRPLHGDVTLSLCDFSNMMELMHEYRALIKTECHADRQVIIIYNALRDLKHDLAALKLFVQQMDVALHKVLIINSIDDSGKKGHHTYGFCVGQQQNPNDFNLLIATASIEMGVTFRAANIMLMEPGFAPMNFLQRYGRAARRGANGQVMVRVNQALTERFPWLRSLQTWVKKHANTQQSIQALSKNLSQSVQQQYQKNFDGTYFGELPQHAIYNAGLYWYELMQHLSNKAHRYPHLRQHQPKSTGHLYALIKNVKQLIQDEQYKDSAKNWLNKLRQQALQLRDIGKRVTLIEGNGRKISVDQVWLQRETNIIDSGISVQVDEKDHEYFQLDADLEDYLLQPDEKNRAQRTINTYFPHTNDTIELVVDASLIKNWTRHLNDKADFDTEYAWDDHPKAMQAAQTIVQLTGLIPNDENEISNNAISGVL